MILIALILTILFTKEGIVLNDTFLVFITILITIIYLTTINPFKHVINDIQAKEKHTLIQSFLIKERQESLLLKNNNLIRDISSLLIYNDQQS